MDTSVVVRAYRERMDDAATEELWRKVFGTPLGGQTIAWMFRAGPAGDSPRVVAEVDGRIVAHAGCMAIRFRAGEEEVVGGYSVAAMTDPAMRGQRLYYRVGRALYEELEKRGFAFVAGFSNRNSYHVITGPLERHPLRPFPWSIKVLSPLRLLASLVSPRTGGGQRDCSVPSVQHDGVTVEECQPGDPRFDDLWERAATTVQVGAMRDASFIGWRFGERANRVYTLLVARRGGTFLAYSVGRVQAYKGVLAAFLVDCLADPSARGAGQTLLRVFEAWAKARGAVLVSALLPPTGMLRDLMLEAGYHHVPELFHPHRIFFSIRGFGRHARSACLTDRRSWFISWADTDVI